MGEHPQGLTGTWEQAKGSKGGGSKSWDTYQRQAYSAGLRDKRRRLERVWVMSKWTALCAGRGGGEWVQDIGAKGTNATDGGR